MKNHTLVYMNHFGYGEQDFIPCECCGNRAVDINHIIARGMGGVKDNRLDIIENLMGMCREHHLKYGDSPKWLDYLIKVHATKLNMSIEKLTEKLNSL